MKIAVLSGKGGTGKTFVSVNLATVAENAIYIDCDVEEPNGRLFFKPIEKKTLQANIPLPKFDIEKCDGCRKCVDFCKFNAIMYIKNKPKLFSEVCHSCGGCVKICPNNAISEFDKQIGEIEIGKHNDTTIITGILNTGEVSGVPIIKQALKKADFYDNLQIIDCPPGSSCSVMESVIDADYCIIVTEPTTFGIHNMKMVYELLKILNKKCGLVINKMTERCIDLESFCDENNISILLQIPFFKDIATLISNGKIVSEHNEEFKNMFKELLISLGGVPKN